MKRKLGPLLRQRYGRQRFYTRPQIETMLRKYGLHRRTFVVHEAAIYLPIREFRSFCEELAGDLSGLVDDIAVRHRHRYRRQPTRPY